MEQTCNRCGAPTTGLVCEYCGVLTMTLENPADEKKAIDEFHEIMLTKDHKTQVNMLKNGFLPTSVEGLIEAGVRCIPLVDINRPSNQVVRGATARLQAIVTKIKLMPDFGQKRQAVAEFSDLLERHRLADTQQDKSISRFLVGFGLLFLLCGGGLIWGVFQWITSL